MQMFNFFFHSLPTYNFFLPFLLYPMNTALRIFECALCVQTHQQRIGNSSKLKRTPTKHAMYAEAHVIHFLIFAIRLKQTTNFYRLHKQTNERKKKLKQQKITKHSILGTYTQKMSRGPLPVHALCLSTLTISTAAVWLQGNETSNEYLFSAWER